MEKHTLRRLGAYMRKEIALPEDLPFPMREALRKLSERYDRVEMRAPSDNVDTSLRGHRPVGHPSSCSQG